MAKVTKSLFETAAKAKKVVKADKIFGKNTKSQIDGAKNTILPTKGKLSKVRGKMSLVPQALKPPETVTPRTSVKRVGRLVENKVQNLVPNLVKSVQSKVSDFDPQAFLGKIFDGGLNSLEKFGSGLTGLQSSLKRSLGFLSEAKGIVIDLIEKMAKAKPQKSKGGVVKGLLKGAAVVGLAALAVKGAPLALGATAAIGGALFKASPLGKGAALAKKVFGRKKDDEVTDGTTSEVTKQFKKSLDTFDEALSLIEMQFKSGLNRRLRKRSQDDQPPTEGDGSGDGSGDDQSQVNGEKPKILTENEYNNAKVDDHSLPDTYEEYLKENNQPVTTTKKIDEVQLPDPSKKHDQNVDSSGNNVPLGTVVGGDDMQPSTVEALSEPTSDLSGQGGPSLVLKPQNIEFIKGNRGALGPQGDPGSKTTVTNPAAPEAPEAEKPKPEGLMRGLAGLGDFLTFGMTDLDGRGDLFKDRGKGQLNTGVDSSTEIPKLDISADLTTLGAVEQITDGISQPARGGSNAKDTPMPISIPVPVGQGNNQKGEYKMGRMANEPPILLSVDMDNMHITTTKSLFNIIGAL